MYNALRRTISNPRHLFSLLGVMAYTAASVAMIVALVVVPFPPELRELLNTLGLDIDLEEQLRSTRGALTLTLLMIGSISAFQNPLLRFAPADIDILFTTPVPLWRVMTGRLLLDHLRSLTTAPLIWGFVVVPLLRLTGYAPWPLGLWSILGLFLLFNIVNLFFANLHMALTRRDSTSHQQHTRAAGLWVGRVILLVLAGLLVLLAITLLARMVSGNWGLLGMLLEVAGGPLLRVLLLPISLTSDLLLLPAQPAFASGPSLLLLLLLDVGLLLLLVWQVAQGGAGVLLEASLTPDGRPSRLDELLSAVNFNPVRLGVALWRGEWPEPAGRSGVQLVRSFGSGAHTQSWRRLAELQRTPLRNMLALLLLFVVPLAIYNPLEDYNTGRLVAALIFSASLGTQLFHDGADHLRYADLELSTPVARWQLLWYAYLPRLGLYWLTGVLLLVLLGLINTGASWWHLLVLSFWYLLLLIPLLALRGALVFLYPAAGLPGQRDPVQAMLVPLINGLLVMGVILLSLLPFSTVVMLNMMFGVAPLLVWPIVLVLNGLIAVVCCALLVWSYRRYEPGE